MGGCCARVTGPAWNRSSRRRGPSTSCCAWPWWPRWNPARHQPRPGQFHHRPGSRPRGTRRSPRHQPRRPGGPARRHRPGRPVHLAARAAAPIQRPQGQMRDLPLPQPRRRPPRAATAITAITSPSPSAADRPEAGPARHHRKNPARTGPQPPTRRQPVTALMTTDPRRDWSGRELAERLQINPRNLHTQLGEWAKLGFITRTGFAIYALNTPTARILDKSARSLTPRHCAAKRGRATLTGSFRGDRYVRESATACLASHRSSS